MKTQHKTLAERVAHAAGFEALALLICAPLGAWILDRPVLDIGVLAVILSTTAMLWNMAYNFGFDRCWPASRVARTLSVRVLHAIGFEGGLALMCVPISAYMLDLSLVRAFGVEIGFLLFMLPYTLAYNWVYDLVREYRFGMVARANGRL